MVVADSIGLKHDDDLFCHRDLFDALTKSQGIAALVIYPAKNNTISGRRHWPRRRPSAAARERGGCGRPWRPGRRCGRSVAADSRLSGQPGGCSWKQIIGSQYMQACQVM